MHIRRRAWKLEYDFVWSQTGPLVPGVIATAAQVWPANLTDTNQVTLTYDRAFTFTNQTAGPQAGTLNIRDDNTIPPNTASVGIGMSGAATILMQAHPNFMYQFLARPEYWIAFGDYTIGEALDTASIPNAAQIEFPPNIYSVTATLNADGSWTIIQTPLANAALAAARKKNPQATWKDFSG